MNNSYFSNFQTQHEKEDQNSLDFDQAMHDFRAMFPGLSTEVIENCLRSNHGAVDPTIDDLLSITTTTTQSNLETSFSQPTHVELPQKASSSTTSTQFVSTSHCNLPFDSNLSSSPRQKLRPLSIQTTNVDRSSRQSSPRAPTIYHIPDPPMHLYNSPPPSYERSLTLPLHGPLPPTLGLDGYSPRRHSSKFNPPLVGKLPDDFLRLNLVTNDQHQPLPQSGQHRNTIGGSSSSGGGAAGTSPMPRKKVRRRSDNNGSSPMPMRGGASLPIGMMCRFAYDDAKSHSIKRMQSAAAERKMQLHEFQLQSHLLRERINENKWQLQLADDPQLARFLEDEQMALMLQDKEFMRELKRDSEFMSYLDYDSQCHKSSSTKSNAKSKSLETDFKNSDRFGSDAHGSMRCDGIIDELAEAAVLEMRSLPYTRQLPVDADHRDEAALKDRLRTMGKNSKRRFALLAHRFLRKQKGAKGILGSGDGDYSGQFLLKAPSGEVVGKESGYSAEYGVLSGYDQPNSSDDDEYDLNKYFPVGKMEY